MKRIITLLLLGLCISVAPLPAEAQFLNKLSKGLNKLNNALEKVDKKVKKEKNTKKTENTQERSDVSAQSAANTQSQPAQIDDFDWEKVEEGGSVPVHHFRNQVHAPE